MKALAATKPTSFFIFNQLLYWQRLYALKKIMAKDKMKTYFQPIYDVQANKTMGFEALNRPEDVNCFDNTDDFYEFVGQTKNVYLFERFCRNLSIRRYCEQLNKEMDNKDFTIFINIHPNILLDKNYHSGETLALLKSFGISPQQVVFELTERSAVTDFHEFSRVLSHYRKQGYRIAVDDVGSGYNSLKTLIYLKPEFIKIDRSLIQNIDTEIPQQQLLSVLLNYAFQSETKVIAEGIERMEEFEYIREAGVHFAQGYAIGRPNEQLCEANVPLMRK
nr:EAL domain-containing protein [Solibacillus sp. MA9]